MFQLIFALAILLIALLFVGVGLLIGRKYVWVYSVAKIIALLITAPLALLLATLAARGMGELVNLILVKTGILGDWGSLLQEAPALTDAIVALIAMIFAPGIFYVMFLIVRPILYAIGRKVSKKIVSAKKAPAQAEASAEAEETVTETVEEAEVTVEETVAEPEKKAKKEKKKKIHKHHVIRTEGANPIGMLCGAAGGLLMALILLSPFVGFLSVADDVVGMVAVTAKNDTMNTVEEITDAAANNVSSKTVNLLGGKLLYSGLTTYKVGDQRVSLTQELKLVESVGSAVGAVKDPAVSRVDAANEIRAISDSFSQSALVPAIAPEVLSAANNSWKEGQSFHGINKPAFGGEAMSGLMDSLLNLLATSDSTTIKTDVDTIVDIVAVLVEKDALGAIKSNPMLLVSNEEVTYELIHALLLNERMRPLVGDVAEMGVVLMAQKLSIRPNKDTLYDDFAQEAAEMIERARAEADVTAALTSGYTKLFDSYALAVSKESIDLLVSKTQEGGITLAKSSGLSLKAMSVKKVSSVMNADAVKALLKETELTMNDGTVVNLGSQESMVEHSKLISLDEINFDSAVILTEDVVGEAKALTAVLSKMVDVSDKLQESGMGSAEAIRQMGELMDTLAATKTVGKQETDRLLTSMLQSETVCEQIGFSVLEATEVAESIGTNSEKDGYAPVMGALGNTVEIVQMSSKNENIDDKVDALLQDLTPESAKVLQTMAKPSLMTSHGVPEKSADGSAKMMSSVFGNLANAKASGMSDEEYKKESKAVADMTNLALRASSAPSNQLFGEGGVLNTSADEYVNNVFDSKVMTKSLVETAYPDGGDTPVTDPLNTGKKLNESENAELMTSLSNRWAGASAEEKASSEYRKIYYSIGVLMNVDAAQIDTIFAA